MDSNTRRELSKIMKLFKSEDVERLTFPADGTIIIQPLEVYVFKPFKSYL